MSKHSKVRIRILDNPEKPYTSLRRAGELVQMQLAFWVSLGVSIRMRDSLEVRQERRIARDMRNDAAYWREVEVARGGPVSYEMRIVPTRPRIAGGPNGVSTLAFIPCVQETAN